MGRVFISPETVRKWSDARLKNEIAKNRRRMGDKWLTPLDRKVLRDQHRIMIDEQITRLNNPQMSLL